MNPVPTLNIKPRLVPAACPRSLNPGRMHMTRTFHFCLHLNLRSNLTGVKKKKLPHLFLREIKKKEKKKKKPACLICFCKKWPENLISFFFLATAILYGLCILDSSFLY